MTVQLKYEYVHIVQWIINLQFTACKLENNDVLASIVSPLCSIQSMQMPALLVRAGYALFCCEQKNWLCQVNGCVIYLGDLFKVLFHISNPVLWGNAHNKGFSLSKTWNK